VAQNRPGGGFDQFWNHRIKKIGVKIVGKNVFAAGSTVPISVELFGNVDRIGFFPDSVFTFTRSLSSFQIPLYQRDPDKRLVGEPFFGTGIGIPAAIGSTQVPMNEVGGWPLFCDNFCAAYRQSGDPAHREYRGHRTLSSDGGRVTARHRLGKLNRRFLLFSITRFTMNKSNG
jgi:hypothetical protein